MTEPVFKPATKGSSKLRLAEVGPSGAGKTFTALAIATGLGERTAVIDTERGSARKYAGDPFSFDVLEMATFAPSAYIEAIAAAARAQYDTVIIDSLSHAWTGKGGALDEVNRRGGDRNNSFAAWRLVTPEHNALVDAILAAPLHIVATMRVRTQYAIEQDERGRMVPKKIGLAPIQRAGIEHEFDIIGELDLSHRMTITKTRYRGLDGAVLMKPGRELGEILKRWLSEPGTTELLEAPRPSERGAGAADVSSGTEVPETMLRVITEAARDAGELRGRQLITDFCKERGYASWKDFASRGRPDALALIQLLQGNSFGRSTTAASA